MKPFAFVFPGQGSQSVGMLAGWGDHPQVLAALQEASDALGEDIGRLIQDGPKEALALTTNTQPVMLVAGVAAYRVWMAEVGVAPQALAGHSLGEYSALVASGVLDLEPSRTAGALSGPGDAGCRARGHGRHGGYFGAGGSQSDGRLRRGHVFLRSWLR